MTSDFIKPFDDASKKWLERHGLPTAPERPKQTSAAMTPTEQDKELRNRYPLNTFTGTTQDELVEFINQYGVEQRVDENNMYIRELTRHYFPSSPSEPHIPLVQFHERIAELKRELAK